MKRLSCKSLLSVSMLMALAALFRDASACTGITLTADDGSVVYGRTMELGSDLLEWGLAVVPRGVSLIGSTPWGGPGVEWNTKYAITGVNAYGLPMFIDGVNEAGLVAGAFMFPNCAGYQSADVADADRGLSAQVIL